jgi:hypothetical protein
LTDSLGPLDPASGPGWLAELDYEAGRRSAGVKLGLWIPREFARFKGEIVRDPVGGQTARALVSEHLRCKRRAASRRFASPRSRHCWPGSS